MRISVYTRIGTNAATTYYRLIQYLKRLPCEYRLRTMINESVYNKVKPISRQSLPIKGLVFFYTYFRVLKQLISDLLKTPDILIVSRRFVSRFFPYSYRLIIDRIQKKGCKIIWDFDDNIIAFKEISKSGFNFLSRISNSIIVASPANADLIKSIYRDKVLILPTTDGDMNRLIDNNVLNNRLRSFENEIRLIWVGTFSSLDFVAEIHPYIEAFAYETKEKSGKNVILTVVCDKELSLTNSNYTLRNIKWERNVAIKEMLDAHVGLMPLPINHFTEGKGGFKLIQYLSVGLPIIGTKVGINNSILDSRIGVGISELCTNQWTKGLIQLTKDPETWKDYSTNAIKFWKDNYNYVDNLHIWQHILLSD